MLSFRKAPTFIILYAPKACSRLARFFLAAVLYSSPVLRRIVLLREYSQTIQGVCARAGALLLIENFKRPDRPNRPGTTPNSQLQQQTRQAREPAADCLHPFLSQLRKSIHSEPNAFTTCHLAYRILVQPCSCHPTVREANSASEPSSPAGDTATARSPQALVGLVQSEKLPSVTHVGAVLPINRDPSQR